MGGNADHSGSRGHIRDDGGVGSDAGAGADRYRPDYLGSSADVDVGFQCRSLEFAGHEPDGDPREEHDSGPDPHESVDDDLAVWEVDARLDDDRVTDAHLSCHHRKSVEHAWQDRYPQGLESSLRPVTHLGEKGVAHPRQTQDLEHCIGTRGQFTTFTAVAHGDLRVGKDSAKEGRM